MCTPFVTKGPFLTSGSVKFTPFIWDYTCSLRPSVSSTSSRVSSLGRSTVQKLVANREDPRSKTKGDRIQKSFKRERLGSCPFLIITELKPLVKEDPTDRFGVFIHSGRTFQTSHTNVCCYKRFYLVVFNSQSTMSNDRYSLFVLFLDYHCY